MSLNIQTISDKSNFNNYFSNPLTIPGNSNIALTKSALTIPIIVSPSVRVPNLSVAEQAGIACIVNINGVGEELTWTEIYASANSFFSENEGVDKWNTPANFFGTHDFRPNDRLLVNSDNDALNTAGNTDKLKIGFNQVLARAIDNKFLFYECRENPTYETENQIAYDLTNTVTTPLTDGGGANLPATVLEYASAKQTEFGFNIRYDPLSGTTPAIFNWSAANSLTNWTRTGADVLTSSAAGVNVAFATENASGFSIDPNGGWVGAVPSLAGGGTMAFGLSAVGEFGGWDSNFLNGGGTTCDEYLNLIDVGWKFTANANGTICAQVIDGKTDNASYSGGVPIIPQLPITSPPWPVNRATAGEKFFIRIIRGTIINGTTEFIYELWSGTSPTLDDPDNLIYSCKRTIGNANYRPTLVCLSDNIVGNIFNSWSHIPLTEQSKSQLGWLNNTTPTQFDLEIFEIAPVWTQLIGENSPVSAEIYQFWKSFGFNNLSNAIDQTLQKTQYFSAKSATPSYTIYKIATQLEQLTTQYIVGQNKIQRLWAVNIPVGAAVGSQLTLNADYSTETLPNELNVSLNNLPVKNFVGSFIASGGSIAGTQQAQRPPEDRTIGTIPFPQVRETGNYLVQYEQLNLIYRPINNPNNLTINEIDMSIFYYDFISNLRKNLDNIIGLCSTELNIKQGFIPKKPNNELLPY
tara:strand:- start:1127 stop:3205 length:2079 start_codon:yes stop_codon:yes gene_type:complete